MVLAAFGIAVIILFIPALRRIFQVFQRVVEESQSKDVADKVKWITDNPRIRRMIIVLIALVAAPWVGLSLARSLTSGESTARILAGAILAALIPLSAARDKQLKLATVASIAVMLYLLVEAGPVSRAAAIVLASWLLLLAGARQAILIAQYFWSRWRPYNPLAGYVPVPPKIWSLALLAFSLFALVVGGRALLTWHADPVA